MRITIRTKETTYQVDCDEGERILYAGLRAGAPLPYECATGTCGTCKARARTPEVRTLWSQAPGGSYLKPERGEFLMCQARAVGDCEILVPGRPPDSPADAVLPAWHSGVMGEPVTLTHDVAYFEVELDHDTAFHAGQFMALEVPGIEGCRAYSMVNYDRACRRLAFVVKKKPAGEFSEWLFGPGVSGTRVRLFGPLGRATFHPEEEKNLLCIAGGSGIAGMMSILSHACDEGYFERHEGHVFFGVRTMQDLFFVDRLDRLQEAAGENLRITVAVSDETAPVAPRDHSRLEYATGLVHRVAGERMSGAYEGAVAFVAGPPPMVDSALRMLIQEGRLPASDIRYDKFS